ncbi:MBL fold metallo-hydrolase [Clostridium sp.]|uniref:MBL fold metallo-hydrolase n=1 Tax=Clostridium sp. TaxID=1506 RepID=UPI003217081D
MEIKLKFLGATRCVTGSSHLLTVNDKKILLDCGLFQSNDLKTYSNDILNVDPKEVDYIVLSHSHVDHSGRIPLLFKLGFQGKVICTEPTKDLCEYLLKDAARIQQEETYFENLSRHGKGVKALTPLYDEEDVELALKNFYTYGYNEEILLEENIKVIFRDAGHILGSAICEILVKSRGESWIKLIYTGDIGNINRDILNNPSKELQGDFLIIESTYGDKMHEEKDNYSKLLKIVKDIMGYNGNLIIPCFSLGRTQEIIYMLNSFIESGQVKDCNVYVDSPLASEITKIFRKYKEYFDKEAKALIKKGDDPMNFKGLHFIENSDDAKKVYEVKSKSIIIVAGGVYDGGRIAKHLRNNLPRPECGILITSYQGNKSIGSKLLKGNKRIKLNGETIDVKGKIYYMDGLSGHADKVGLYNWVNSMKEKPKEVFLVHGEGRNLESFTSKLKSENYSVITPDFLDEFALRIN